MAHHSVSSLAPRLVSLVGAASAICLVAGPASAQIDISPPAPNVLLLVDSSGSMEYKSSSADFPTCDPGGLSASEKSRWVELVEVLTGTIENYRCDALDRSSTLFRSQYSLDGNAPYDLGYPNPYHRPLSDDCGVWPGSLSTNVFEFPSGALQYHPYGNPSLSCAGISQSRDGLLDSFDQLIRFSLMTFDTHVDPSKGYNLTNADFVGGMRGAWSYYWGTPATGKPADCSGDPPSQEVGARNMAAPPWEGRMVTFGPPTAGSAEMLRRNDQIQQVLLATRPYGGTPIAGLMYDARDYLLNDDSADPLDNSEQLGPKDDPYVGGGCRETHVVLLSDGEPNLDLRPHCAATPTSGEAGKCPYPQQPDEVASDLANNHGIKVHVVGFAVSTIEIVDSVSGTVSTVDCTDLTDEDLDPANPSGLCAQHDESPEMEACCTLNRIASYGDTGRARFADNVEELRQELGAVLFDTIEGTSRTRPVFAAATSTDPNAVAYRFFSAFLPTAGDMWTAQLERQRWTCEEDTSGDLAAVEQDIDSDEGDDFVANVNSNSGPARVFYTYEGQQQGPLVYSQRSIRPYLTQNDGAGVYSGSERTGSGQSFTDSVASLALFSSPTAECATDGLGIDACRDRYLRWLIGLANDTDEHRCPNPGTEDCKRVGAIYHSTPVAVNRPAELIRDETYDLYASEEAQAKRPLVLYSSTTDGFLHAFKVAPNDPADSDHVDSLANNELWSFIPPAVLPSAPALYGNRAEQLLDGVPVVRDVIATGTAPSYEFERTATDAQEGTNTWRTVLVQGFGEGAGYFALDVTEPESGPRFLWQLTTDSSGNRLFGDRSGTPLITTLFFGGSDGVSREVAVAVLPGGKASSPSSTAVSRATSGGFSYIDSAFQPRDTVPSYTTASDIAARSITIVRLDNGEIIRTFRQDASEVPAGVHSKVIEAPLDSPISGQPAAFPGATGAVADRIFVGDADGSLWRLDVSAINPDNWQLKLFFDTHTGGGFDDGQPIVNPPVLSVDVEGNVTVAAASGDQEVFTPSGTAYVWSLTDAVDDGYTGFETRVNWYKALPNGERVVGPLSLFSEVLYFATYTAPSAPNVCGAGLSKVWGMHYTLLEEEGFPEQGGQARIDGNDSDSTIDYAQYIDSASSDAIPTDATIFGVTVAMVPTCVETTQTTGEGYFGTGTHTTVSQVTPAKFQLLMQTGRAASSSSGGQVNFSTLDLPTPGGAPTIDSWAAILE